MTHILLWASENRSPFCESSPAKQDHNQHDDDDRRQQPATDVHDESPCLRLSNVHAWPWQLFRCTENKKNDVMEHPKAFDHVGLLVNQPPGTAGLLFI
jgi:hypothetical protein